MGYICSWRCLHFILVHGRKDGSSLFQILKDLKNRAGVGVCLRVVYLNASLIVFSLWWTSTCKSEQTSYPGCKPIIRDTHFALEK